MNTVMKELLINTTARTSTAITTLTVKTMNAGVPLSSEE